MRVTPRCSKELLKGRRLPPHILLSDTANLMTLQDLVPAKVELTSAMSAWFTDAFSFGLERETPGLSLSSVASTTDSTSSSESECVTGVEGPWLKKVTRLSNVEDAPLAPCSRSITSASTASCSESESINGGDEQLGNSQRTASLVEKDFVQKLCGTIMMECGFLRISSMEIRDEASSRAKRHGSTATLRIYVNGLPLTKRAKWLAPLHWSVSAILQRRGWSSKVQSNELYVPVNDSVTYVRMDLVANTGVIGVQM